MEKIGLDYDKVKELNPRLIYGEVTGYGRSGPWKAKPGQDLLVQSLSGLTWLTGSDASGPVPMGLAVVDMLCGAHFVQGLLAALVRRGKTGKGARVEVSLLASAVDFQFEVLTTHFHDGNKIPQRAAKQGAHAYLSAPYGTYRTRDGWLAIAMGSLTKLAETIGCTALASITEASAWFSQRDRIQEILAEHLTSQTTAEWATLLEGAKIWCAPVQDYATFLGSEAYAALQMEQTLTRTGKTIRTTRCPIRIDGERLFNNRPAPKVGEQTETINKELLNV
jgi:crotonobetainyl-CoA:carnitine CoA-transferase CaiB-like acyl-CoA transferase